MSKRPPLALVPSRKSPGAAETLPRGFNLPNQATRLIGRKQETASVCALLRRDDIQLLTLLGPPGVGKTRLSLHVAESMLDDFSDGVYFVPLASITDPDPVPQAIARAIDMSELSGAPLIDLLIDRLRDEQTLLILDNFEQVTAAALLVSTLLSKCADLKIIVTSRVPLRVYGEQEFAIPSLQVPHLEPPPPRTANKETWLQALEQVDSVALFVQRARLVRPSFALTEANATAVAQVCAKLDGLPLTIELAAARIKYLSPQALLSRLEHRLEVLRDGPVDLPPRQQTLRNAIAWSYDLLDAEEQSLLRAMSIFIGGGTLEAAAAVAAPSTEDQGQGAPSPSLILDPQSLIPITDHLGSLADKSLLRWEGPEDAPRVSMLETIREFGLEMLKASGEEEEVGQRHADYYTALAAEVAKQIPGPDPLLWFVKLENELGNLRASLRWLLERGQANRVVSIIEPLTAFWSHNGHLTEGIQWFEAALDPANSLDPAVKANACLIASYLAYLNGSYDRASLHAETNLALNKELGNPTGIAQGLHMLGSIPLALGDYEQTASYFDQALALYEQAQDKGGMARILNDLGELALRQSRWSDAAAYFERCLVLFRELGWRGGVSIALSSVADMQRRMGNLDQAVATFQESLRVTIELGTHAATIYVLEGLAEIAQAQGYSRRAARLLGAAERRREEVRKPIEPDKRTAYNNTVQAIMSALGNASYLEAWEEGRQMSGDEDIAYAQQPPSPNERNPGAVSSPAKATTRAVEPFPLTRREREVVTLIAQGKSNNFIASHLVLSQRTVETHITHVLSKLGFSSRGEIAAWAYRNNILATEDEQKRNA